MATRNRRVPLAIPIHGAKGAVKTQGLATPPPTPPSNSDVAHFGVSRYARLTRPAAWPGVARVAPPVDVFLSYNRRDNPEVERHAKAAEVEAQWHLQAVQRLAAEIQQHHDTLARLSSAEHEAPELIQAAERLMQALTDAMITLHGAENAPLAAVARKWAKAKQMSAQITALPQLVMRAWLTEETRHE